MVSVIITAFKTGAYLPQAVASFKHQNYDGEIQIIVGVDGCEETLEVAKNIKGIELYYSEKNVGTFVLRNTLVKKAKYDNLIFFDSDDVAMNNLVSETVKGFETNDIVRWAFYNYEGLRNHTNGNKVAEGAFAIKKDVFLKYNGFFPKMCGVDTEFNFRTRQHGCKVLDIWTPFFYRREHGFNLTRRPDLGMKSEYRAEIKADIREKIQNNSFVDPDKLVTTTIKKIEVEEENPCGNIGIGITTYNRSSVFRETLAKIKQFSLKGVKIVIVDDGNITPTPEATFRFAKNQGAPIAKNKCLELLQDCEHIFLFDDDTFPIKEGWEQEYINASVPHLNYTFKYAFKEVGGVRYYENPNGCMMYIHKSVLDKVGGFDTGFIKYGYWHGAYSNRVFNSGMIPHPFIDIANSGEYLYCLDQDTHKRNRPSSTQRGLYLSKNKRRYQQKIGSSEYIPFTSDVRIFYSNPYNTKKNIGKALNEFCELVPDGSWICLQDGDMFYLTPDWGVQIEEVAKAGGYDLIGCMTNRLARRDQRVSDSMDNNHDILYHYEIAKKLKSENWAVVKQTQKPIAGMFMLFPKETWKKTPFAENDIAFDDTFSKAVRRKGGKLGIMTGLYVYHFYRGWSADPAKDRKHLK